MRLTATNVKLEPDKLELAKLKGCNVSQLCRDALDSYLRLTESDSEMLKDQLVEIRKQIQMLSLEEKLVLTQLDSIESSEVVHNHRESKYDQWKKNLAYQINNNTIDWNTQKEIFKFKDTMDCKKWMTAKLKKDSLI